MDTPSDRHLPEFEVEESLQSRGCPLCTLLSKQVARFFDRFLYENLGNPYFRHSFRKAGGFCRTHAWMFMNCNDGLAVAVLYRELLGDRLSEINGADGFWKRLSLRKKKDPGCFLCELCKDWEQRYLSVLRERWNAADIKNLLLASDGFCAPHYHALCLKGSVPRWLAAHQKEAMRKLIAELGTCLDSWEEQQGGAETPHGYPWRRALSATIGENGLFGR
ncbi:MAG: hypothetical protein A2X49_12105 [Lentisphaerae bacterium GWF2_52_8]|nr:MAG: hypothetical protein A2X49_12105 [Lentisphaerae bacterium GWF2_52_8]